MLGFVIKVPQDVGVRNWFETFSGICGKVAAPGAGAVQFQGSHDSIPQWIARTSTPGLRRQEARKPKPLAQEGGESLNQPTP